MNETMERYSSFRAHQEEVRSLSVIEEGVLSISPTSVAFHSHTGLNRSRVRYLIPFLFPFSFLFLSHSFPFGLLVTSCLLVTSSLPMEIEVTPI